MRARAMLGAAEPRRSSAAADSGQMPKQLLCAFVVLSKLSLRAALRDESAT